MWNIIPEFLKNTTTIGLVGGTFALAVVCIFKLSKLKEDAILRSISLIFTMFVFILAFSFFKSEKQVNTEKGSEDNQLCCEDVVNEYHYYRASKIEEMVSKHGFDSEVVLELRLSKLIRDDQRNDPSQVDELVNKQYSLIEETLNYYDE